MPAPCIAAALLSATRIHMLMVVLATLLSAVIIAMTISAQIRPYSTAVAPLSSSQNFAKVLNIVSGLPSWSEHQNRPKELIFG